MAQKVQHVGLKPFTSPKTSYDTTGAAVAFRYPGDVASRRSAHLTIFVHTGTALISLDGNINGPFIELSKGGSFDFPIETEAVYIKGVGGPAEVAVVAATNPVTDSPRGRGG